ncbi:MAG: hypothetical protein F6J97_13000 [Leptolyngbya sp. SIO4C1]|nr:hypothetical protein [Leptolyngbya sp. SIO4C1]
MKFLLQFLKLLNQFRLDDISGRWWLMTLLQGLIALIAAPVAINLISQLP